MRPASLRHFQATVTKSSPLMHIPYLVALLIAFATLGAGELPLPPTLVALDSHHGIRLLEGASWKLKYATLAQHYTTQVHLNFCGAATGAMVLNALGVQRPPQSAAARLNASEYDYFTQDNIFSKEAEAIVTKEEVRKEGMSLDQLSLFLNAHPDVASTVTHCSTDNFTVGQFREAIASSLRKPGEWLTVNFDRTYLTEQGEGHHSPVAAYNEAEDMVLVMDVSRYKYTAWWTSVSSLFKATCSSDAVSKSVRGFLQVSAAPNSQAAAANSKLFLPDLGSSRAASPASAASGQMPFVALLLALAVGTCLGAVIVMLAFNWPFKQSSRCCNAPSRAGDCIDGSVEDMLALNVDDVAPGAVGNRRHLLY